MANTTAQTTPSSLFDDTDFIPPPPRQAPVEAVTKKPVKKTTVKQVEGYVIQRRAWTEEDTIALRDRLARERAERGQ
jgi:hypothetical protein